MNHKITLALLCLLMLSINKIHTLPPLQESDAYLLSSETEHYNADTRDDESVIKPKILKLISQSKHQGYNAFREPISKGTPHAITGLNSEKGIYYPKIKMAWIVPTGAYEDVIEYQGGGRTPPTVYNSSLVAFAKMLNPNYTGTNLPGAPAQYITLYGIKNSTDISPNVLAPLEIEQRPINPSTNNYSSKKNIVTNASKSIMPHVIAISSEDGKIGDYYPYSGVAYLMGKIGKSQYFSHIEPFVFRGGLAPQYNITPQQKNKKVKYFAFYIPDQNAQTMAGSSDNKIKLFGIKHKQKPRIKVTLTDGKSIGIYNPIERTIKQKHIHYRNITEYLGGGLPPPSINNPSLRPIATMPNPNLNNKQIFGSSSATITLYGQLATPMHIAQKDKFAQRFIDNQNSSLHYTNVY